MARLLEDQLQSLVRLCVVAPTVNVSFGAQVAACKAPLPQGKIKDVLETQVRARARDRAGVRVRLRSWTPSTRRSP